MDRLIEYSSDLDLLVDGLGRNQSEQLGSNSLEVLIKADSHDREALELRLDTPAHPLPHRRRDQVLR